jgi:hypothetical protein
MKTGDLGKIQTLLGMAQDQDLKIERGLKYINKLPKNKKLKELNAIELEAKEFQKIVLQLQRLKGGLKRRSPDHARVLSEIELIEDKEVDLHLKFQKVRKQVLGLDEAGAGGGGNSKGVLMAAALGMKIGEQGVKKTEEILATLRKANDLMDSMQGDILEQRKKLFRIQDQVKNAQSLTNRGKEVMKYFANQASKDVCIKVLVGLIAVMIIGMGVLTYQISQERDMIEASPEELAEKNLQEIGLEVDENGKVTIDSSFEGKDGDYYMDNGRAEQLEENERVKKNYIKAKEEARLEQEALKEQEADDKLKNEEDNKSGKEEDEEISNNTDSSDITEKDEEVSKKNEASEVTDKDEEVSKKSEGSDTTDKDEEVSKKSEESEVTDKDDEGSKKEDELLERKLRERMLRRNRKVLTLLHVG